MISSDTPPGTEIVCIDDSEGAYGPSRLTLGGVYTVKDIRPAVDGDYVVLLHEVDPAPVYDARFCLINVGWLLCRFRYLEIPKSLSELLTERELEDA